MPGLQSAVANPVRPSIHTLSSLNAPLWSVQRRIPSLDSVRGAAAVAVVLHHAVAQFVGTEGSIAEVFAQWLGAWGVGLFFVLSGFCIHLPRANRVHASLAGGKPLDLRVFWRQRARRLLPAYVAALAFSACVAMWVQTPLLTPATFRSLLSHLSFVHVWTADFHSINAVLWSVAVEVHFYLAYPIFLLVCGRFGVARTTLILLVLGLAIYGVGSVTLPRGSVARLVVQNLFLVRWWEWALGAWCAEAYASGRHRVMARACLWPGAATVWLCLSLGLGLVDPVLFGLHLREWLLPFTCVLLLGAVVVRPWVVDDSTRLAWLGTVSYSLYLIHPVAIAACAALTFSLPLQLVVTVVLSVTAAAGFHKLFEAPFMKARA